MTYTTMPPAKRFRDMDQLSGGEKVLLLCSGSLRCYILEQ